MAVVEKVKIGVINDSMNMLDHFVALDAGIYREEGLDVELVIQMSLESMSQLDSGDVMLSSSTMRVVEAILLKAAPYKFVLITRREPPHYILGRPGINAVADLKGKVVWGSAPGAINYYQTLDWLRKNGLEPGADVRMSHAEDTNESFFSGRIPAWVMPDLKVTADAVMAVPPEADWLVREAGFNELVELCQEFPNRMIHGLAGHPETLKKKADIVRRTVRAHVRASRVIQEDGETTVQVLMNRWSLNREVAEEIWRKMNWRFIAETDPSWLDDLLQYVAMHLPERFPEAPIHRADSVALIDKSFV